MTYAITILLALMAAGPAMAGPLDTALGGLIGTTPTWWLEMVALISAGLGLVSALVRDSAIPSWAKTIINLAASNWGAAANDPGRN